MQAAREEIRQLMGSTLTLERWTVTVI